MVSADAAAAGDYIMLGTRVWSQRPAKKRLGGRHVQAAEPEASWLAVMME